jgi:hypothetical protein
MPGAARAGLLFLAFVVLLNGVAAIGNRLRPAPSGPPNSSYATSARGVAALAELLEREGRHVERLRADLADASLDPAATVVLLDPDRMTAEDATAVRDFVEAGGRLVAGGPGPSWLDGIVDHPPDWDSDGARTVRPLAPGPEVDSLTAVEAAGDGAWGREGPALPLLGAREGPALVSARVGSGRALLLADASPLQNRLLDHADNAALGLALAGERGRRVIFVEGVHGYGEARGLAALPARWKWTLGGLGLAALALIWALGRRLGPPEDERRPLPPPRRRFVEAQALTLSRTGRPEEAAAPVRAAARDRLARRAALPHEPGEADLRRAAQSLGLPQDEADAVLGDPARVDVLAAGRALARLNGGGA